MFFKYIWYHKIIIFTFVLFLFLFLGVFSLYNLELEAVFYAFGLCAIIGTVIFLFHYYFFYRKHKLLCRMDFDSMEWKNKVNEEKNLIEQDYQKIIVHLLQVNKDANTKWNTERNDSIDYYTTWVHQIKTPIALMRLILQSEDTREHQELLSELFRVEQYVEMVLCYFRLDSSSSDFLFMKYSLDQMIRQSIRKYAGQFVRNKIKLIYKGTDVQILTDEKWFCFILEQLLSNAIKYTQGGTVKIELNDENILSISDTGIGISPEDLPRIFEKGFTGYNGRANKKATGIGLYLCKQAADKLSHSINVSSQIGKGTTFFIDLNQVELEMD